MPYICLIARATIDVATAKRSEPSTTLDLWILNAMLRDRPTVNRANKFLTAIPRVVSLINRWPIR